MTTPDRSEEYRARAARFGKTADGHGARSRLVSNLRGLSFGVAVVSAIVAVTGRAVAVSGPLAAVGLVCFLVLLVVHSRVIAAEDTAKRWARVNLDAVRRVTGKWRELPENGARFADANHPYAGDLDLFGPGSLFQRLSVTHTRYGQEALARFLTQPESRDRILGRQQAVRVLGPELETRQELEALALAATEPDGKERAHRPAPDPEPLLAWAESTPELRKKVIVVWAARALPILSIAGIVGSATFGLPALAWGVPIALSVVLNLVTRDVTSRVFVAVSSTEGAFLRYGAMLGLLEKLDLPSPLLKAMRQQVVEGGKLPSEAMAEFRRAVSWYDLKHNGLIHPFANALLLWDIHCTLMLEAWQTRAGKAARGWFRALGELEALSSFAGFLHDDPGAIFPELVDGGAVFEAEALAHPLLLPGVRVSNDLSLPDAGRALLVTGSNMSGKSTMLRSMGLAAVMTMAGAPVVAKRLRSSLLAVRTSMRISDSLDQGVSHFYAEVRKLKVVLDATAGELPVFFLLDEVLHGTNSRERQVGARWMLSELIAKRALGAVSTHDMELCRLPDHLMQHVEQVHFQESVQDGAMTFDYRLRPGPVTAGNALRLMKIVGLDVPLE
ncbi:MAG: DNA mismatch repair protein MutS [Polyangiaceae bacterium]|nr:DNA mismatch repair protein MutS [Polyangiaceae bacterium]